MHILCYTHTPSPLVCNDCVALVSFFFVLKFCLGVNIFEISEDSYIQNGRGEYHFIQLYHCIHYSTCSPMKLLYICNTLEYITMSKKKYYIISRLCSQLKFINQSQIEFKAVF